MAAYKDDGKLWVLVADEGVARLLRLPEEGGDLEDVTTLTDAAAHADKADLRRDAAGRRGNSVTASAGVDELHQEAISFASRVAKSLASGYHCSPGVPDRRSINSSLAAARSCHRFPALARAFSDS